MSEKKGNSKRNSEYVVVQVRVPKRIAEFIQALGAFSGFTMEEFWKEEAVNTVRGILDSIAGSYVERDWLIEHYGLQKYIELEKQMKDC